MGPTFIFDFLHLQFCTTDDYSRLHSHLMETVDEASLALFLNALGDLIKNFNKFSIT